MRSSIRRLTAAAAGTVALATVATVLPFASSASALPGGTAANGGVTLTPTTGNSGTIFTIAANPVGLAACPNAGGAGERYHTFITPAANDPAVLVYSPGGTPPAPAQNLRDTGGTQIRAVSPNIGSNTLSTESNLSFAFIALAAGTYKVGLACNDTDSASINGTPQYETDAFWFTTITVQAQSGAGPNNFVWTEGQAPTAAPTINSVEPDNGQLTVNWSSVAATPNVSTYVVTAQPQPSGSPTVVNVTAPSTTTTIPSLVNGVTYAVTVAAQNRLGTGPNSVPVNGIPNVPTLPAPVLGLTTFGAPGSGNATLSWTLASNGDGAVPTGFTVTVTGSASSPYTVPFTAFGPASLGLSGLNGGTTYTVSVTVDYPAPFDDQTTNGSFTQPSAQLIVQQISVVRPQGALILTQRCGRYGDLPNDPGEPNTFPGYPDALTDSLLPSINSTSFPYATGGTAPRLVPLTEGASWLVNGGFAGYASGDPEFGEYPNPFPVSYPTYCGVELGVAELITDGPQAGFYKAAGRLNQVSVLDTRDTVAGWTLGGTMSDFVDDVSGDTFDGSYLGWTPRITDVSGSTPGTRTGAWPGTETLEQSNGVVAHAVMSGAEVLPGKEIASDCGLGNCNGGGTQDPAGVAAGSPGELLATANVSGKTKGVAVVDAYLKLLIPPTAGAGTYEGSLTLSFLSQ